MSGSSSLPTVRPRCRAASTLRHPHHVAQGIYATLEGAVMGTPHYMSPEQAEGKIAELDGRSDIFSLGGILYALLTLRPPVEGDSLEEILSKVRSGTIAPPTAFNAPSSSAQARPAATGAVVEPKKIYPLAHCPGGKVPSALSAVAMKALDAGQDAAVSDRGEVHGGHRGVSGWVRDDGGERDGVHARAALHPPAQGDGGGGLAPRAVEHRLCAQGDGQRTKGESQRGTRHGE